MYRFHAGTAKSPEQWRLLKGSILFIHLHFRLSGSCVLFSLLNLLLSLLLPLPLTFFSVPLHDLLVIVGKHGIILICQWDEDVTGGETTGNGVLRTTQMRGKRIHNCETVLQRHKQMDGVHAYPTHFQVWADYNIGLLAKTNLHSCSSMRRHVWDLPVITGASSLQINDRGQDGCLLHPLGLHTMTSTFKEECLKMLFTMFTICCMITHTATRSHPLQLEQLQLFWEGTRNI